MTRRIPRVLTAGQIRSLTSCPKCTASEGEPCVSRITGEMMGAVHPEREKDAQEIARQRGELVRLTSIEAGGRR